MVSRGASDLRGVRGERFKYVAVLFCLLAGGFLAVSLIGYSVAQRSVSQEIADSSLPLTSDNIYSEIQRDLLTPILTSSMMARDTFLRDWVVNGERNPDAMVRFLKEIQDRHNTVTAFFVSEASRKYYHSSGVLKTVSEEDPHDKWYFRVRDMADEYEINVDWDTANLNSLTIFINYRIMDYDGNFIGTTGVGLAMKHVMELMETYQERYGRRVLFVDSTGTVTLHGTGYEGGKTLRDIVGDEARAATILGGNVTTMTFEREGDQVFFNSRMVPEFGWYILVEQTGLGSGGPITRTLLLNLALSFAVTLVVLLLASFILGRYQKRLEVMATTDKLTGALNRQAFEMIFDQVLKSTRRRDKPVSMVLLDVDHFKAVNDGYGHQAGDRVLADLVTTVQERIRETDVLCRWGGEEFLLLLPDCDIADAEKMAEKIRSNVEDSLTSYSGRSIRVTVSCGVAQSGEGETEEALVQRADQALYRAKKEGRNRVVTATA